MNPENPVLAVSSNRDIGRCPARGSAEPVRGEETPDPKNDKPAEPSNLLQSIRVKPS